MKLPDDVSAYKRTAVFDQETLPAGLRRNHSTAAGVWAVIHILEGRLIYRTVDPPSETVLDPDRPGVVAPQEVHEVEPCGPVRLFIEFHARPDHPKRAGSGRNG